MKEKFKPGDHVANRHGAVWRVVDFTDGVLTGVVVGHSNTEYLGQPAVDSGEDGEVEFEWEVIQLQPCQCNHYRGEV